MKIKMPNGGDETINPASVYVLRQPTDAEREEAPLVQSCLWGSGFRIYPAETVPELFEKIRDAEGVSLARLTAPNGFMTLVNASAVTDRDEPSGILDHDMTRSVLSFGPGAMAARVRVRETRDELLRIWEKLSLPSDPLT